VSFTSTSVNAHHFYWSFGDAATSTEENPIHIFGVTGNYTVTLITEYCGLYDTTSQTIAAAPVGIETLITNVAFFPNPVKNILTITTESEISGVTISDASGRIVLAKNLIRSQNTEIDLSALEDGIYFIRVETPTGIALQKIVKNTK